MITSKRILLAVSGGIAAYKAAELARLLVKSGHHVIPVMTESACKFLGPLTLEGVTGQRVRIAVDDGPGSMDHIHDVRSIDLMVIAPATAHTISKMVHGAADNFLTASYLAHVGSTLVCPAMNAAMLAHPATQRNLTQLKNDGVHLLMGEAGSLACGEEGHGRLAEPSHIEEYIQVLLGKKWPSLVDKNVLVTAGPTYEDLDPVRFLGNRSSGKMGYALAKAFRDAGANVTLVSGPSHEIAPQFVEVIAVRSAAQMHSALMDRISDSDVLIMNAAVADYRPVYRPQKIKKSDFDGTLVLERTTDILAEVGASKPDHLFVVGFAAETHQALEYGKRKLVSKKVDAVVVNVVGPKDRGFAADQNQATVLWRDGGVDNLELKDKGQLADDIVALLAPRIK